MLVKEREGKDREGRGFKLKRLLVKEGEGRSLGRREEEKEGRKKGN